MLYETSKRNDIYFLSILGIADNDQWSVFLFEMSIINAQWEGGQMHSKAGKEDKCSQKHSSFTLSGHKNVHVNL